LASSRCVNERQWSRIRAAVAVLRKPPTRCSR
jgi:hypothetical protein